MKTYFEYRKEAIMNEILEIKKILPYLGGVNNYLYQIYSSIGPNTDETHQYYHLVYDIKLQLNLISWALNDEHANRFTKGHVFLLKELYDDSLQLPTKSIQEKLVLELLIKVCDACIIVKSNCKGEENIDSHLQADFALVNTRKFIAHLINEYERNADDDTPMVWFDIYQPNYINS